MGERVEFLLRPSRLRRRLCLLELGLGAALYGALLWRQPLAWWLFPAALAWFAHGVAGLREPRRALIRSADGWWLGEGGAPPAAMRLLAPLWSAPGLVVFGLAPVDGGPTRLLALWPDNLPDAQRRRLSRLLTDTDQ